MLGPMVIDVAGIELTARNASACASAGRAVVLFTRNFESPDS